MPSVRRLSGSRRRRPEWPIRLYPAPAVLHTKFLTVDDDVSVIGSSTTLDMRSFHLDYEVSLMVLGWRLVRDLQVVAQQYRDVSLRLELESWNRRPWPGRYVDNVMRLHSFLQCSHGLRWSSAALSRSLWGCRS